MERHIAADLLHDAGDIRARCQRQLVRTRTRAAPDPCVPRTDAGSLDANQHLPVGWHRLLHLLIYERVDTAERVHSYRHHGRRPPPVFGMFVASTYFVSVGPMPVI